MSKRIVVDPITRIEGHLRVEVIVDDKKIYLTRKRESFDEMMACESVIESSKKIS